MASFKVFLLALLFIASSSLSLASELHVPGWEDLGDCARACIGSSLRAVLDDPSRDIHNSICPAPSPAAPQCHDFCDDPTYNSSLTRCLKINCPKWVVGEILLLNNHIICNISERQNVNFNRDGSDDWEAHWPKTLNATGTETVVTDTPHKTGFAHPWVPTVTRRGVQGEFVVDHIAVETTAIPSAEQPASTFASGLNATTTATCRSIATATTFIFITVTPGPSTNISATTIFPSTSCSCNSTSTLTTSMFTTVPASSVLTTDFTTSHHSTSTHVTSLDSTRVTTTHSTATISLPSLHTATGAAAAVDVTKLWAIGAGGAGVMMLGLL